MERPSPPVITSAFVDVTGDTNTVQVEWAGFPRVSPQFQWLLGPLTIRGATAAVYVGAATACIVTIDNGRGFATAIAIPLPIVVVPPDPMDPDALSTLLGFDDDAPLLGFEDDAPLEMFTDA